MLQWLAVRRQKRLALQLEKAGDVARTHFAEPIAFVAQEWVRLNKHMLAVSAEVWMGKSLAHRIAVFEGLSPAINEVEEKFPVVLEKIYETATKAGSPEGDARDHIIKSIFIEAIVATGENRQDVYATLLSA